MSHKAGPKVALITGANGGLGRALVNEFVASGWRVVATARQPVEATDARITPLALDVADAAGIDRAVGEILKKFNRLDLLVNNAGLNADALLAKLNDDEWARVLDVNLNGAFRCARAVARQMLRQRDGHIINISSFAARGGRAGQSSYAAAKAGLVGLTQSLAKELGSRNVRVNTIFPGVLPTNMTAGLSAEQLAGFAEANALGRINSVEEVARFIAFLATTQNISGQVFALDSRIAPWT